MPKTSAVPHHPLNPETHDASVIRFIEWANEDLRRAAYRQGERQQRSLQCFTGNMGLAAHEAETAAILRGCRFTLLPNRDRSIDAVFASVDEARFEDGAVAAMVA